jgi:metal-dependent hydrolase (beta-lactamase superfamily II)
MQFNRRAFLCGGSASVLSAISGCPAYALEDISAPCVEWLALRIVAVGDRQQSDITGSIPLQSLPAPSAGQQQDATIHVQSASGTKMRSFLIDPGSDARVLLERAERLRIDLSSLDALVLSGDSPRKRQALNDFLSAANGYLKKDIEVVTRANDRRVQTASLAPDAAELACADDAGQSRVVGGQMLVVGARQYAVRPLRSDTISLIGYQPAQRLADTTQISANFVLLEKGLVVVTSSNEGIVDCVKAAQAASGCGDVHAIVGMNIGAGDEPATAQSILSGLLELKPAHLIVSADVAEYARRVDPQGSTKIVAGLAGTRVAFR